MSSDIRKNFKSGFKGIINNSGGFKELFFTKFNFWSVGIFITIIILYFFNIKTAERCLELIDNLYTSATSVLGGIVGLSLAGLTLIITFSNPEVIERSIAKQVEQYLDQTNFDPSYFQKAIAKFSFIVFLQVVTLIFFFVSGVVRGLEIETDPQIAYWVNTIVFCVGIYLMIFSLILVIASVVNLFTFSQTSTFLDFMKKLTSQTPLEQEEDKQEENQQT